MDRQRNDCVGRGERLHGAARRHWREILRAIGGVANPNINRNTNSYCNCDSHIHSHANAYRPESDAYSYLHSDANGNTYPYTNAHRPTR